MKALLISFEHFIIIIISAFQEVVLMEMGVINLEFYHNLQHITLRLTVEDPDQRDQLLPLGRGPLMGPAVWHFGNII